MFEVWSKGTLPDIGFCELESLFFFMLFFHYSFSFALQRWFLELDAALPQHFKSIKMKHKWWRSKKVISDSVVIGDWQFYPTLSSAVCYSVLKNGMPSPVGVPFSLKHPPFLSNFFQDTHWEKGERKRK
jgi:hypothetical protein